MRDLPALHIAHVSGTGTWDAETVQRGVPRPVVVAHDAVGARFDRNVLTVVYRWAEGTVTA
ncbi:MAG TPA: hypothetical protein VLW50_02020 [Streptosporangiaceae bacterium]|nr:hypothetical protein [Streptosporangiaceae bacterium]